MASSLAPIYLALALDRRGPDRSSKPLPQFAGSNSGQMLGAAEKLETAHTLRDDSQAESRTSLPLSKGGGFPIKSGSRPHRQSHSIELRPWC
jgi:hypothetical protein